MLKASALPVTGVACCNSRMLQGKDLGAAIKAAMELKAARPGAGRVGPTALARALGMSQPSASELLNTGRLAKEKLPLLLDYFEDVVGPDHFGLPYSKFEADFLKSLRLLPAPAQRDLLKKVQAAGAQISKLLANVQPGEGLGEFSPSSGDRGPPSAAAA